MRAVECTAAEERERQSAQRVVYTSVTFCLPGRYERATRAGETSTLPSRESAQQALSVAAAVVGCGRTWHIAPHPCCMVLCRPCESAPAPILSCVSCEGRWEAPSRDPPPLITSSATCDSTAIVHQAQSVQQQCRRPGRAQQPAAPALPSLRSTAPGSPCPALSWRKCLCRRGRGGCPAAGRRRRCSMPWRAPSQAAYRGARGLQSILAALSL